MGFFQWLQQNPEPSDESQLDLFGNSQDLVKHKRVDGATVRKGFTDAIQNKKGGPTAHPRSTVAMTEELFDCKPNQLYQRTGAKRGRRETLPTEAQKAYIVGETVSTHDLNESEPFTGDQEQIDAQIVDSVRDSSKKVRKLFPW